MKKRKWKKWWASARGRRFDRLRVGTNRFSEQTADVRFSAHRRFPDRQNGFREARLPLSSLDPFGRGILFGQSADFLFVEPGPWRGDGFLG